ncbi:hypothetical protein CPSG_07571 [Coccidioides posadasii str. Silveira]|uniref:Uncharacterized protein n=1 Tax=Coccidioides posadasii (strain RMSCC 757 / Silveira) TaxID=443226 RepID=E9DCL9_COCPS|nr:hypothetical protein CPSG_07571 [Coccidioides posadasii str. Silveira]
MASPRATRNPAFGTYRSPYAPRYSIPLHFKGFTLAHATKFTSMLTVPRVSDTAAQLPPDSVLQRVSSRCFFLGDVPRVREDILMNIPVIGSYWERHIAPEDNGTLLNSPHVL